MKQLTNLGRMKRVFIAIGIAAMSTSGYSFANGVENITGVEEQVLASQQEQKITGVVTDASGFELPGVSISIKGTTIGTVTNIDGRYQISVEPHATLLFSFVGMKTEEILVNNRTVIDVTLEGDAIGLNEVVAIGYGYQKKANLTGSTSIVESKDLVKRPVTNGAALLQGRVAGLNIVQNSGQPGETGERIRLRGVGSFGNTTPLVLVDGVEGDLDGINPADVENMTVLKDAASAAIYGARAANGVILVTTKTGQQGDYKIDLNVNYSVQQASRLPDFIYDSVEYMEMWNKGAEHTGVGPRYSQEMIDAYRYAAPDDPRYPNYNWMEGMFNTALRQEYQMSARGGTDKSSTYVNLGFVDQEGIIDGYGEKKYTGRVNVDLNINEHVTVGFKTGMTYQDIDAPTVDDTSEMMLYIYTMPPTMSPYLADGSGRLSARDIQPNIWRNRNPQAIIDNPGKTSKNRYKINPQAYIEVEPFKGLLWKTTAAWRYDRTEFERGNFGIDGYNFATNERFGEFEQFAPGVAHNDYRSSNLTLNSVISYTKSLGNHGLSALAGYEQHEMNYDATSVYRPDYSTNTTTDINAGLEEGQEVGGYTSSWALQSLFGRLSYDYKGKYLLEANFRYDGSSKLAPDYRWDFFPSASMGWRLSEESFMEDLDWIDNLKVRFSAGKLGNVNSIESDYPYQSTLSNSSYPINGSLQRGVANYSFSNPELTWETVTSYNLGFDYSILNGLFAFELDLYKKITEGGHTRAQIPGSVGKTAPYENYRDMENKGIDIVLRHANRIGEFRYDASFTFDKYKNEITKIQENGWGVRSSVKGHAINEYYMLDWIGVYQNQDQVDNLPIYEPYRAQTQPGDLIYRDTNKDGEITTGQETGDRVFVDGYHPDFTYSFNFNAEWKGFDMSMFWQGVEGRKDIARWIGYDPFMQGGPVLSSWRNAWDGEGSTNSMPALYNLGQIYGYNPISGQYSTYHLHDVSYLRLKNLQIGYTLPNSLSKKAGIEKFRIYASGDNLITITDYDFEPERREGQINANTFPQLTTYTIGANITF